MKKFIVHVPHARITFPSNVKVDSCLMEEAIYIADYMVDLFVPLDKGEIISFPYSRLWCDVERFVDDNCEVMAKYGMGVVYTHDSNGKELTISKDKKDIIKKYYNPHHKILDKKCKRILEKYNYCYIIDLHSFSDDFVYKIFKYENNPDICIGYDGEYVDKELLKKTKEIIESYGYSVKDNYPYEGSIIPNYYYGKKCNLSSIMIEINKRIYLDEEKFLNIEKYTKLKECMDEYFEYLDSYVNKMVK